MISENTLFECEKCGDCCRGFGGTYVTDSDLSRISAFTGISRDTLVAEFCEPSGGKFVLGRKPDGYCLFWDRICTIHPVKPRMCRAWPFIEGVLRAPENWRVMAGACPGIRADAPEAAVIATVREQLARLDRDDGGGDR